MPWPAMISGWSKGGTYWAPVCGRVQLGQCEAVVDHLALEADHGPVAAGRLDLGSDAPSGMKMVDFMPAPVAAKATPWAWLPAEAATTSLPGGSCEIRL